MNILIIGHPGSGKSYLAEKLSQKTGIEKVDIDVLFDRHPFYATSKRLYQKALGKILKDKREWVIDGYHVGLMPDDLFLQTSLVLFLNLPEAELKKNVLSRYKQKKANREFSHWQSTYFNNWKNFAQIRFQEKALAKDILRIKELLQNRGQFVELKSRDEIAAYLKNFL